MTEVGEGRIGPPGAETCSHHASAVAIDGRALLITGPGGSGKSTLAVEMIARGAVLISDDQVILTRTGGDVVASAPDGAPALVEARGIGLIPVATMAGPSAVHLVIDLGADEADRLPPVRTADVLGVAVRSLRRPPHLSAAALVLALRTGGPADVDSAVVMAGRPINGN